MMSGGVVSMSCSAGALVLTLVALFGLARLGFHPMKTRPTQGVVRPAWEEQMDALFLWNWTSSVRPFFKEDLPYSLRCCVFLRSRVKVVAAFGMAFLRNKNGGRSIFKPLPRLKTCVVALPVQGLFSSLVAGLSWISGWNRSVNRSVLLRIRWPWELFS